MNKTIKKLLSLFIAITVTLSLSITNYAAEQSILVAKIESLVKNEYSNAIVHAFQRFRAPFSGKIVHIFPEQSAVI